MLEASIRRHGEKDSGGGLSAEGVEHAKRVAEGLAAELRTAPEGSVFFVMPSTVGRAKATRDAMEFSLKETFHAESDVEITSIQGKTADEKMIGLC